jgi:hypothetical protein
MSRNKPSGRDQYAEAREFYPLDAGMHQHDGIFGSSSWRRPRIRGTPIFILLDAGLHQHDGDGALGCHPGGSQDPGGKGLVLSGFRSPVYNPPAQVSPA